MKRALKIAGIAVLLIILFRGPLFRLFVSYKEVETRTTYKLSEPSLQRIIDETCVGKTINENTIVPLSLSITTKILGFTSQKGSHNPNQLITSRKATCVGYAAMFNTIIGYLISKHRLEDKIETSHKVANLYVLGINVHPFLNSAFLKDHDYNEIRFLKTGQIVAVDPSLKDYFGIEEVRIEK